MSLRRKRLMRVRRWCKWWWVGAYWVAQCLVLYLLLGVWMSLSMEVSRDSPWGSLTLGDLLDLLTEPEFWTLALTLAGAVTAAQAVFLYPIRRPAPRLQGGLPVWASLAMAGTAIAVLFGGAVVAVAQVLFDYGGGWVDVVPEGAMWIGLWSAIGLSWVVATPLLVAFSRGKRRETALARIASRLFLGTIVEAVALIPLDVMVRRKTDCYSAAGTMWAYIACGTVGTFALGPAMLLPVLARRRKRWYGGHCDVCGYDMSGTMGAARCPECGSGWRTERPPRAPVRTPPPAANRDA